MFKLLKSKTNHILRHHKRKEPNENLTSITKISKHESKIKLRNAESSEKGKSVWYHLNSKMVQDK